MRLFIHKFNIDYFYHLVFKENKAEYSYFIGWHDSNLSGDSRIQFEWYKNLKLEKSIQL